MAPESFFAITLHKGGRGRLLSMGRFSWDSLEVLNKVLTFEGGGRRLLSTLYGVRSFATRNDINSSPPLTFRRRTA